MLRCPHCKHVDDEINSRGYCVHCGEDVTGVRPGDSSEARAASKRPIRCPECGKLSDSIKAYDLGTFVFLGIAWISWGEIEEGCPPCIRAKIMSSCFVNLVTANVLWPFTKFPLTLINLLRSTSKGHSRAIRKRLRERK